MVSVGSTNFDNRSFSINDEANLNVMDRDFAKQQVEIFEADWAKSKPITLQAWENRPWTDKLHGEIASLIGVATVKTRHSRFSLAKLYETPYVQRKIWLTNIRSIRIL